jgi:hypothetical protein
VSSSEEWSEVTKNTKYTFLHKYWP